MEVTEALADQAIELIKSYGYVSRNLLQRKMRIGSIGAGRIIGELENRGIVKEHIEPVYSIEVLI
jgi:ribosomal protein S25